MTFSEFFIYLLVICIYKEKEDDYNKCSEKKHRPQFIKI